MAGFAYRKASTENDKAKIGEIVKGFGNSFLLSNLQQIESVSLLVPEQPLPQSFEKGVNEALRFTIETYINEFPAGELFALEKPVFEASIGVEPYYELKTASATVSYHAASVRGHVEYIVCTLNHDKAEGDEIYLEEIRELKGKFTTVLYSDEGRTVIAAAERNIHIQCAPPEGASLEAVLDELLYEIAHEAVHAVTMPDIIRKAYINCSHSLDRVLRHPHIKEAIELAAYSLGPLMFCMYRSMKGMEGHYPLFSIPGNEPGARRGLEIVRQSGGSLGKCHALLQDELSSLLKPSEG